MSRFDNIDIVVRNLDAGSTITILTGSVSDQADLLRLLGSYRREIGF
jgi:hypothetical protein